jgi:guanine deaminase
MATSGPDHEAYMRRAIALSRQQALAGEGGPFGAVIVRAGQVIAEGANCVTTSNDPTAHAEVVAIRRACAALGGFALTDCVIYSSCEPCPMCLSAIYWARLSRLYYANSRLEAAAIGFDDDLLYREMPLPPELRRLPTVRLLPTEALEAFEIWRSDPDKVPY